MTMPKHISQQRWAWGGVLALPLLAGCAVGPDFHRPKAPTGAGFSSAAMPDRTEAASGPDGAAQHFVQGMDIPGQWWNVFHSPTLDALVRHSLRANPTLDAAQGSLRVAQENLLAQQGSFLPSVGLDISDSQNETPTRSLSPVAASNKPTYSLFTGEVTVAYTPDVFGLNHRTAESYAAQADNMRYQLEAAYLTLTSNVVMTAIEEAGLRAQIAAQQDVITIDRQLSDIITRQVAVGELAQSAAFQQQTVLAQAQQVLLPLQKKLSAEDFALKALAGGFPNDRLDTSFDLASLHLPQDLPVSLPSQLVEQRPDILAASANMHAASAGIGVAIATRLPQLSLTAALGTSPNAIQNVFTPYNQLYEIVGGLSAPLFQGGTLLHRQRAAEAQFTVATAQFKQAVIAAFQNVADVLRALQVDADALRTAETAETAASKSLALARDELQQGEIAYNSVLTAEQAYQMTRLALVQAQAARLSDTAALFQALGGGWWNRDRARSGRMASKPTEVKESRS